jgi:hypothetical protein
MHLRARLIACPALPFYHYSIEKKGSVTSILFSWVCGTIRTWVARSTITSEAIHLKTLVVVYNATATDGGSGCLYVYGNDPPVGALQLLKGPTDGAGTIHHLDHFMYYNNDFSMMG